MYLMTQNGQMHDIPKEKHLFLEIDLWESKSHKHISILAVVNLSPIVLQVLVFMSSVLMNRAEVYATGMMLLTSGTSIS
jgi:hypothetical protein